VETATAFGYGDFEFSWGDHICAVFESRVQQMEVMGAFISAGIRAEQRCVWVAPDISARALREYLAGAGGDVTTLEASSQLLIISDIDFYLEGDLFNPARGLDLLRAILADNEREGYMGTRIAAEASWLGEDRVDPDRWEEYEAGISSAVADLPVVTVCQYTSRQLTGPMILTAFRTHPTLILGNSVRENPLFEPARIPAGSELL
jgi:hypothetical protein